MIRIASLEDDLAQVELIRTLLTEHGYDCACFTEGRALMAAMRRETFDLVLLDWHIPDINGEDVVRWLRANVGPALPVLFLTSRSLEEDLVQGLAAGADDYMVKPIRRAELLARIQALLRRASVQASADQSVFQVGPYTIDPETRTLSLHGEAVPLRAKEFDLALLFFRNPGRLMSRDHLTQAVWNREIPATSRTLDTHLSNIRQKLCLRAQNGVRLTSSYALGYRLERVSAEDEPPPPAEAAPAPG